MFSTSLESTLYGGFLPPRYHSLVGDYSIASSSNQTSNMSTSVINPTNEGLTSEQFITMISCMLVILKSTQQVVIICLGDNHHILLLEDKL